MSVHIVHYFRHVDNIYAILMENLFLDLLMRNLATWENPLPTKVIYFYTSLILSSVSC